MTEYGPIRILLIEDDGGWVANVRFALQDKPYVITDVKTIEDAAKALAMNFYHILLIDIQLSQDTENREGLEYLRSLGISLIISSVTELIMFSVHVDPVIMRETFRDYRVADFIDKTKFSIPTFVQAIDRIAFNTPRREGAKYKLNFNLRIRWHGMLKGAEDAITGLKVEGIRLKPSDSKIADYSEEFTDLMHRLFDRETTVVIEPLRGGFSGAGVLRVHPYLPGGGGVLEGQSLILKFGARDLIEKESANFKRFVEPHQVAAYATTIDREAYSIHLGAILYSLIGTTADGSYDFDNFYTEAEDETPVIELLSTLFQVNLGGWYNTRKLVDPPDLNDEYWTALDINSKIEAIRTLISVYLQGEKIVFPSLSQRTSFSNPLAYLDRPHRFLSVFQSITHGDLNERNILVDPRLKRPWLIDFTATSDDKHMLRDFAELDMSVRLELLRLGDATLDERLEMEKQLLDAKYFQDLERLPRKLTSSNPKLQKAYATALMLRTCAYEKMGRPNDVSMEQYYIALFYFTLNAIRYSTFSPVQREHAILCCSLLSDILSR